MASTVWNSVSASSLASTVLSDTEVSVCSQEDAATARLSPEKQKKQVKNITMTRPRPSARSVFRRAWRVVLGLAALLDCISTVLPRYVLHQASQDYPYLPAWLAWLDRNAVYFGFVFSFLCCIQAFRDARDTRLKALREQDRKRLLRRGESIKLLQDADDLVQSGYFGGTGPWLAFYATLTLQLFLVPVGFYVLFYQAFQVLFTGRTPSPELVLESAAKDDTFQSILNSTFQVMETSIEDQRDTARVSVLVFLVKKATDSWITVVGEKMRKWAVKKGVREGAKVGVRAIITPHKVWKQTRKAIQWARWIKYLAPLVATSNKLRENVCDLLKKHRQRQEKKLAGKIRKILWKEMTPEDRRNKAARGIQSMYRSYRVRKARWALAIIQCHRDEVAAIRVQSMLRKMLQRARARIRQKRAELKELEARERSAVRGEGTVGMSAMERKRLYELQDEMQQTAKTKSIDRKMLLRPNTRFAVTWKFVFVFCVLIEMTQLAVDPILAKQKVKGSKKPMTFATKLESVLIPQPVSVREECYCQEREKEEFNSWILKRTRPTLCPPQPWYCRPTITTAQNIYSMLMKLFIDHFMIFVGVIVFLDVPVFFYTGELCRDTGTLIPKPFFERWIAPGLLLQFLVNPQMETTSKWAFQGLKHTLDIGPIRVLRWIQALFYPCLVIAVDLLENKFWVPAVARVNQSKVKPETREETPLAVRRRESVMRVSLVSDSSATCPPRPRRSSLPVGSFPVNKRSPLMPMRRSSIQLFAPSNTKRTSWCFPNGGFPLENKKAIKLE